MKADSNLHVYIRIVLVSFLVAALGLFPSIRSFNRLLDKASQAATASDWQSAAQYLAQAASAYPWRTELFLQAGRYAYQAGDMKTAINDFERPGLMGQLTTNDLVLLGNAFQQTGELEKAEATWKQVAEQTNSADALQRLADLYLQQQDSSSAISYLKKLLALNPADASLNYRIGLLYAVTEPLQALPYLAQAADIDPSLADKARSLHDKIRTASLYDRPSFILLSAGRELANQGEWPLAEQAFERATQQDPSYADAWAFLGEARQQKQTGEAPVSSVIGKPELERALQLDSNSVLANTFMAIYWERHGDNSEAQHYLEAAIAINPNDPYLYSELGNVLSRAGDLPAAQLEFENAIRHAPQDPTFYRLLAQFTLENRIQLRELALPSARQALMLNPRDPASLDMLAQVMTELQDYFSAEDYCLKALSADPHFSPAYLHLGMVYVYLGKPDQAFHWLQMAKNDGQEAWVSSQATRMLDYYFPR